MGNSRFRNTYRTLTADEAARIGNIKVMAERLEEAIDSIPDGREKSLALTKLEEAVMWACKALSS